MKRSFFWEHPASTTPKAAQEHRCITFIDVYDGVYQRSERLCWRAVCSCGLDFDDDFTNGAANAWGEHVLAASRGEAQARIATLEECYEKHVNRILRLEGEARNPYPTADLRALEAASRGEAPAFSEAQREPSSLARVRALMGTTPAMNGHGFRDQTFIEGYETALSDVDAAVKETR